MREEKRKQWFDEAEIILLLISREYIGSEETRREAELAFERRRDGTAIVIPVYLAAAGRSEETPFHELEPLLPRGTTFREAGPPDEAAYRVVTALAESVERRRQSVAKPLGAANTPIAEEIREPKTVSRENRFRDGWLLANAAVILSVTVTLGLYAANPPSPAAPGGRGSGNNQALNATSGFLFEAALVGVMSMALIQIFRKLVRMRGGFHRDEVYRWLDKAAFADLEARVKTGPVMDMFDLPSEMLAGQLGAIAEQALEELPPGAPPPRLIERMSAGDYVAPQRNVASGEKTSTSVADTRTALALAIQRNLDHFQISTAAKWRRYLLATCITSSAGLFTLGLGLLSMGSFLPVLNAPPLKFAAWLGNFSLLFLAVSLVSLFGGLLGSISRDLVAIIEKLRR